MGGRVEEDGKSEGHPVMGWIGIEPQGDIIPTGNGADFHRVSHHEKVGRIVLKGGKANERFQSVCILRRWARRLQVSIVKVAQQCCITGSCNRGLCRGLSRMKGNFHARFLGEGAAVMPLPYPTQHGTGTTGSGATRDGPERV